jgi:hypothetical protein
LYKYWYSHYVTHFIIFLQGSVSTIVRAFSDHTDLKDVLNNKIPYEQERVKKFRKEHGNVKIGEITVDMVGYTYEQIT